MKKLLVYQVQCALVLVMGSVLATPRTASAENHVVPPAQIQKDLATASTERQQNQQQVKSFLSSPEARQAIQSAHMNAEQVTSAVSQLNDSDLARLAARSSQAQKDFAAGTIGNRDLLLIVVAVAVLILIIVAVR